MALSTLEESLLLLHEEWCMGEGGVYLFCSPERPLSLEIVALRAMFSLHMLENVHSIYEQWSIEHSMYSMISMATTESQIFCCFCQFYDSKNYQYRYGKILHFFVFKYAVRCTDNNCLSTIFFYHIISHYRCTYIPVFFSLSLFNREPDFLNFTLQ
jgi:hypothetical protein